MIMCIFVYKTTGLIAAVHVNNEAMAESMDWN